MRNNFRFDIQNSKDESDYVKKLLYLSISVNYSPRQMCLCNIHRPSFFIFHQYTINVELNSLLILKPTQHVIDDCSRRSNGFRDILHCPRGASQIKPRPHDVISSAHIVTSLVYGIRF